MRGASLSLAIVAALLAQPLSAAVDEAALAAKIARYWNLGAVDAEALQSRIVLRVHFAPDGKPMEFQQIDAQGPTPAGVDQLFQTARRAVLRAHMDGGLPLPLDEPDSWRVIDLVFDAKGMRLR